MEIGDRDARSSPEARVLFGNLLWLLVPFPRVEAFALGDAFRNSRYCSERERGLSDQAAEVVRDDRLTEIVKARDRGQEALPASGPASEPKPDERIQTFSTGRSSNAELTRPRIVASLSIVFGRMTE